MRNPVEICNRALRLNDLEPIASFDDDRDEAETLRDCWQPCVNEALQMYDWSFALREERAARLAANPETWKYAFALPDDFIRLAKSVAVCPYRAFGVRGRRRHTVKYQVMRVSGAAGDAVCADEPDIMIRYISNRTTLDDWSQSAVDALTYRIAEELATSHKHDLNFVQLFQQKHQMAVMNAASADRNDAEPFYLDNSGYDDSRTW